MAEGAFSARQAGTFADEHAGSAVGVLSRERDVGLILRGLLGFGVVYRLILDSRFALFLFLAPRLLP